jgi:FKBP-type peptidyl-prolyl cis-trans isomerase FkpA
MSRKWISVLTAVVALSAPAAVAQQPQQTQQPQQAQQVQQAQQPTAPPAAGTPVAVPVDARLELTSDEQKTLYALGLALSQNLTRLRLQAGELAYVVAGLEDGVLAQTPRVPLAEFGPKVQALAQSRFAAAAEQEQAVARDFLAKMAAEPGAVKSETGVVMFTLQEGTGASPKANDVVRVHYKGTLPDGSIFDSSIDRGQPNTFPLDGVISCWTEALQKVKVGGKARIVCPPALAYGAEGRPGIPPNSPLVFEVELLGIGDEQTAPTSPQGASGEPVQQPVAEP